MRQVSFFNKPLTDSIFLYGIFLRMSEKILVVEDEPSLQETLVYSLKKEGYEVEAVGDGRSALESARKLKPDLIVLDIMLP